MLGWPIFDAARASRLNRSTRSALWWKRACRMLDRHPPADVDVLPLVDPPHRALAAQTADVVTPPQRGADARVAPVPGRLLGGEVRAGRASADRSGQHRPGGGDEPLALALLLAHVVSEQRPQEARQAVGVGLGRRLCEKSGQVRAQELGVRVAVLALDRQRAHDDPVQLGRHAGGDLRRRHHLGVAGARHGVGVRLVLGAGDGEELPPGQELPQQDAGRVDVDPPVERVAPRLLR